MGETDYYSFKHVLRKDGTNLLLLLVLYTLQGIPMGLSGAIPYLLQGKVSYQSQGVFSLVTLPFSLKLLWAPIVDSVFVPSIGRRKTWLIPVQSLAGLLMIWAQLTGSVHFWIEGFHGQPYVKHLAAYFFLLYLLMATQDIAVDGWALCMLSRENKSYASTCNTIGQTMGYLISQVGFLALNDPATCNKLFRTVPSDKGMVSISYFLGFWGWIMILTTAATFVLKRESEDVFVGKSGEIEICETKSKSYGQNLECPMFDKTPRKGSLCCAMAPCLEVNLEVKRSTPETPIKEIAHTPDATTNSTPRSTTLCSSPKSSPVIRIRRSSHSGVLTPKVAFPTCDSVDPTEIITTSSPDKSHSLLDSYRLLWKMLTIRPVQLLVVVLLTCRIPFSLVDSVTHLKLMEQGMSTAELAFFSPVLVPFALICPILVGKWTSGMKPLRVFRIGYLLRIPLPLLWAGVIVLARNVYKDLPKTSSSSHVPLWYYLLLGTMIAIYNITSDVMFVAQMSLFARISDESIGGTYMTLLNTVSNLGSKWSVVVMWLLDAVTKRDEECVASAILGRLPDVYVSHDMPTNMHVSGGKWLYVSGPLLDVNHCPVTRDGYFYLMPWFLLMSIVFIPVLVPLTRHIDNYSPKAWIVSDSTTEND